VRSPDRRWSRSPLPAAVEPDVGIAVGIIRCSTLDNAITRDFAACPRGLWRTLEPEVGLEPTTCALRGRSTESHKVPPGHFLSHSVLVRTSSDGSGWTHWDRAGHTGTQLLGRSWDQRGQAVISREPTYTTAIDEFISSLTIDANAAHPQSRLHADVVRRPRRRTGARGARHWRDGEPPFRARTLPLPGAPAGSVGALRLLAT
jgi:hypothetical protein